MRFARIGASVFATLLLAGCGTASPNSPNCFTGLNVTTISPGAGVADHMDPTPGDQQQFTATSVPQERPGCAIPTVIALLKPAWTVSDAINVKISSATDDTNGLATCIGATKGAVTVSALSGTPATVLATATLTCK